MNIKEKKNQNQNQNQNQNRDSDKILIGKRSQLYRRLFKIRDILPGAFSSREVLCGNPNCICKREGKRHKVYQYSYKIGEKQVTKNIPKEFARQVEKQTLANKQFKTIMKQIHELNLEILFNKLARKRRKS
jgi:DNA-binding TFAR19-related protein (PDSD5 family)